MCIDTTFQQTIIHSLLYVRHKKIDKIVYSSNVQINDYYNVLDIINTLRLDDTHLNNRLQQTQLNINMILEGTVWNFTEDEIKSVKEIDEGLQRFKTDFCNFEKERSKRLSALKEYFPTEENDDRSKRILEREINKFLKLDDRDYETRYREYIAFLKNIEIPLAKITLRRWGEQLTKPEKYRQGTKFKFLVHAINTSIEAALQEAKNNLTISTSLITDEFNGTYKNSKFGFVYQPNVNNVLLMSSSDCYADPMDYSSPIDPKFFSLTHVPLNTNKYLIYAGHDTCKTMHIEEIERSMRADNRTNNYNEIVLTNDPCTNPIAVFLIEESDTGHSRTEEQAIKLHKQLGLPLVRI